jgi:hypothetical protein
VDVAGIFRRQGGAYRKINALSVAQHRVMRAIELCRTAALGGQVERCSTCAHQRISYNSCRNRHCPKCQNLARAAWLEQRNGELLPVEYFHVVFTIPEQLNGLALQNQKIVFKLLFQASARTLLTIARDPKHLGAEPGFFSVLHTWGQNLQFHPHIHCVTTGGGLTPDRAWKSCLPGFFLPVRVLSALFRRLFLEALSEAFTQGELKFFGAQEPLAKTLPTLLDGLAKFDWVVYAKPPFGGPQQVINYLGRYTHRIAISDSRLLAADDDHVTFQYKDYRSKHRQKSRVMKLGIHEFIRRFLLHVLPPGFQRIRHYGLLAGRRKKWLLPLCRQLLGAVPSPLLPTRQEIKATLARLLEPVLRCPACQKDTMARVSILPPFKLDSS